MPVNAVERVRWGGVCFRGVDDFFKKYHRSTIQRNTQTTLRLPVSETLVTAEPTLTRTWYD